MPERDTVTVRADLPTGAGQDELRDRQPGELLRAPDAFQVPPGELSAVHPDPKQPEPFRCLGCVRQECQVSRLEPEAYTQQPAASL